jgi:hypothetical protein
VNHPAESWSAYKNSLLFIVYIVVMINEPLSIFVAIAPAFKQMYVKLLQEAKKATPNGLVAFF